MDIKTLRELYDREQRREVVYPDTRREATETVVRHTINIGRKQGWVLWSKLDENSVEDAITEQIAYFDGIGSDFEWKAYDYDTPSDLTERLAARGFTLREPSDAIMVLDIKNKADVLNQPVPDSIRRVVTAEEVHAVIKLLEIVWNESMTSFAEELVSRMENSPDTICMYAAFEDGRVASGAWMVLDDSQFCSLWGGSTLPEYRKRGLYTGLLALRAKEARQRGKRFLTVDASPMSR